MSPVLDVQDLRTHFFTRDGVVKAVDGVSFTVNAGEVLGLVGESGSGKSVTGFSILGLVDAPGRVVGGSIRFGDQELVGAGAEALRSLRGRKIAMIFQDPMMTLNPVLRVDTQMIEAIQAHERVSARAARARAARVETRSWARTASIIWVSTRSTGLRVIIGSWKIMAIFRPRKLRSASAPAPTSS